MNTSFLKKLALVFISISSFGLGVYVYGCADGWWGYSYISSFTPEAFVDESYKPLFYAPEERFYDYAQFEYIEKHSADIVADWTKYLGKKMPQKDVAFYLLNDSAQLDIDTMHGQLYGEKATGNKLLKEQKVKNFINFLHFAKRIEASSTNTFSSWDYDDRIVHQTDEDLVSEIEQYYAGLKKEDAFFRNRMWFQVMKAKFYSEDRSSVIAFFESTESKQPKNSLYNRALGYVAGAYYQLGEYGRSNTIYAGLFNDDPAGRHEALYNFKPFSKDSLDMLLAEPLDKNIQASIIAMNGYYVDEAAAMRQLYRVQPKSPHLDFLLTRWVNVQEYKVNDYNGAGADAASRHTPALDEETTAWLGNILKQPKSLHNPGLVYLAYGYTSMLGQDYPTAAKAYQQAAKWSKGKSLVTAQIRLFNLLNQVAQLKKVDTKSETDLLADLKWLYNDVPNDSTLTTSFRYAYASSWIKQTLSNTYASNDNALMAELLDSKAGFYDDAKQGDVMEKFLLRDDKSGWDDLFANLYPYNLSDIYESRAIFAYYQERLDDAIALMEKAQPERVRNAPGYDDDIYYNSATLRGNPFNGKIRDCNDCDHEAPQKIKYTKLAFLRKVRELKQQVDRGTDVFNNALLLGNAYYSTAFFGNARLFYYNMIIGEYGNYIEPKNQAYLLSMDNAQKYYDIALAAAENNEQRAKLSYLLAKVDRNNYYTENYLSKDDYYWGARDQTMFSAWTGFKALRSKYADTKYYQEVIKECGYFRSYVMQENSKGRY